MKILHIDSSANTQNALSRSITKYFVEQLQAKYPDAEIKYRDVASNPLPFVDDTWLAQGGHDQITDELTQEFLDADIVVAGVPVYNYNVPASFKAYLDQIIVAGKTFRYTPQGPEGLAQPEKQVYIFAPNATTIPFMETIGLNFHKPYLLGIFDYMGVKNVHYFDYTGRGEEGAKHAFEKAKQDIQNTLSS